ncbi:hypothetical protein JB92DRAFT_3099900 [Gautieria morchelliformis]|nr:hypothetical protein JB92DRAFT_3099900 [Gautieria morchelliformis]
MSYPPPAFTADDLLDETPRIREPAPSYQAEQDIWARWTAVDRANQRVADIQVKVAELEAELQAQDKEFQRMKEKSSKLFESIHGKSRTFVHNALRRIHSGSSAKRRETKDSSRQEFEAAHREETSMMMKVESLRERIDGLNTQMQHNMGLASEADQVFELLGASFASSVTHSPAHLIAAEERFAEKSRTHDTISSQAQTLVTDLLRARVTVQHAHHYYMIVLHTIDALRGTAIGRAALGGMGELSKHRDYRVAAETASKAQICFNETVRVLTPHVSFIPEEVMPDFEKLKEMGLLQATKIYDLMYSWKHMSSGDAKSMKLMLQKQETVFACLTRMAVWVQNEVPTAEADLRAARVSRDQARRELTSAWKAHIVSDSLPTPS